MVPQIKSNNCWESMKTTSSWWSPFELQAGFGGNENQVFFAETIDALDHDHKRRTR